MENHPFMFQSPPTSILIIDYHYEPLYKPLLTTIKNVPVTTNQINVISELSKNLHFIQGFPSLPRLMTQDESVSILRHKKSWFDHILAVEIYGITWVCPKKKVVAFQGKLIVYLNGISVGSYHEWDFLWTINHVNHLIFGCV